MKTIFGFLAVSLLATACGDNKTRPDAKQRDSSTTQDAYCSSCPAAPTLGAQIDRMGRAAINTALTHGFDTPTAAEPFKDAYNQDANRAGWVAAYSMEFMKNLGIVDALDTGLCGNGLCETGETNAACAADCAVSATGAGDGCGNQALYNGGTGTTPMATSYQTLAGILASDELYLDTTKTTCGLYLAVEFGVVTGGANTTCGGRAPQYDVMDFSLSMLTMGVAGFNPTNFDPKFKDNAPAHTDYLADFPFLGPPH